MHANLATSGDVQQGDSGMLRLASVSSGAKLSSIVTNENRVLQRSQLRLGEDMSELQKKEQLRQIILCLAGQIEGNRKECELWMCQGRIESLGGLTPDRLVDQGLGVLVANFLLEIITGKRG